MPLNLNQPVTKLNTPAVSAAQDVVWTMEMPHNIRLGAFLQQVTITKLATGGATKSVPALSDVIRNFFWEINGTPNRTYLPEEAFGLTGDFAVDDDSLGGTVQYFQAAAAVTAAVDGITYGALPVPIGSAADVAIKAALANNTDTVAVFGLPHAFAQDFRKSYAAGLAMCLPTGFSDKSGAIVGNLGGVILKMTVKPVAGGAGNVSAIAISGNVEYDEATVPAGAQVRLLKMKRLSKQYAAAGDIEVADQIKNVAGEAVQFVYLETAADPITKVIIKQGNKILQTLTWEDALLSLRKCGINMAAMKRNRFPIIFDRTDDPTTGLGMNPNAEISIMATLATANDGGKTIVINTGIYGAVE